MCLFTEYARADYQDTEQSAEVCRFVVACYPIILHDGTTLNKQKEESMPYSLIASHVLMLLVGHDLMIAPIMAGIVQEVNLESSDFTGLTISHLTFLKPSAMLNILIFEFSSLLLERDYHDYIDLNRTFTARSH